MLSFVWFVLTLAAGWVFFYLVAKATDWVDDRFFVSREDDYVSEDD